MFFCLGEPVFFWMPRYLCLLCMVSSLGLCCQKVQERSHKQHLWNWSVMLVLCTFPQFCLILDRAVVWIQFTGRGFSEFELCLWFQDLVGTHVPFASAFFPSYSFPKNSRSFEHDLRNLYPLPFTLCEMLFGTQAFIPLLLLYPPLWILLALPSYPSALTWFPPGSPFKSDWKFPFCTCVCIKNIPDGAAIAWL